MIIRATPPVTDFGVRTSSNGFARDEDWPRAEDWAVLESLESLRSTRDNAEERDGEDERFIALMLGGDAFD